MGRDVPFSADDKCDVCGSLGAYDFMGDYICQCCLDNKSKAMDELLAMDADLYDEPQGSA